MASLLRAWLGSARAETAGNVQFGTLAATPRLLLRPARLEDAPALYSASEEPQFVEGLSWQRPKSILPIEQHFEQVGRLWRQGTSFCFSAVERLDESSIVGGARLDRNAGGTLELGYWVHPRSQRRGMAAEFLPVILEFGFGTLTAARVTAKVAERNAPSRNLLLKLGFSLETIHKDHVDNWLWYSRIP